MLRDDGNYLHIDFGTCVLCPTLKSDVAVTSMNSCRTAGHFLGNFKSKFGIKRETAPFVFTHQFAAVLGGSKKNSDGELGMALPIGFARACGDMFESCGSCRNLREQALRRLRAVVPGGLRCRETALVAFNISVQSYGSCASRHCRRRTLFNTVSAAPYRSGWKWDSSNQQFSGCTVASRSVRSCIGWLINCCTLTHVSVLVEKAVARIL